MANGVQVYKQVSQPSGGNVRLGDIWIKPGSVTDQVYICSNTSPSVVFTEVDQSGGSGNLSGTLTTGVVPMASGPHALVDSSNGKLEGTGGAIGFNNNGTAEVVADGSSLNNAGLFAAGGVDFAIHDSTTENNWQFLLYNDSDGIASGVVLANYGTYPHNNFTLTFGDGAGSVSSVPFGVSPLSAAFDVGGGAVPALGLLGTSGRVIIYNSTIADPLMVGAPNLGVFYHDGTTAVSEINASNNAGTAVGGIKVEVQGNTATSKQIIATMEAMDDIDDVSFQAISPRANNGIQGAVILSSLTTTAGHQAWFQFNTPENNGHAVALAAPDSVGAGFIKFNLPGAVPAANGQPLVSTTGGVMSFAAGVTTTVTTAGLVGKTMTFTGGILTSFA